jgi:hypothetical protein
MRVSVRLCIERKRRTIERSRYTGIIPALSGREFADQWGSGERTFVKTLRSRTVTDLVTPTDAAPGAILTTEHEGESRIAAARCWV